MKSHGCFGIKFESQSKNGKVALIGSPDAGTGVVDIYAEGNDATALTHSENLTCSATGISGFGTVVRSSNNKWHITGARLSQSEEGFAVIIRQLPNSEVFQDYQLLTVPTGRGSSTMCDFGYSVAISQDSRVIWVGAPGIDKVYGYQLNEYEDQLQRFTGDGSTREFDLTGLVDVDSADELSVVVNNILQTVTTDWSYSTILKTVTFVTAPLTDVDCIPETNVLCSPPIVSVKLLPTSKLNASHLIFNLPVIVRFKSPSTYLKSFL